MIVDVTGYEELNEATKEVKELMKKWKPNNKRMFGLMRDKFRSDSVTDEEYIKLKDVIKTLRYEEDYKVYKKAFDYLCKYCHIVPNGTIISKYILTKGKEDDANSILVEYTYNTKPIDLPEDVTLYHYSTTSGIKELKPFFRLRGRNENGYLCDKPRVYFTLSKALLPVLYDNDVLKKLNPKADSKFGTKTHTYEIVNNPRSAFVDPMVPETSNKCAYIETMEPIRVRQIK